MVYLDYSATTPIDMRVLECFIEAEKNYFANANSTHALGQKSAQFNQENLNKIAQYLNIKPQEFILTSSAVEANNFAIKGMVAKYPLKKHIITSQFEHGSVVAAIASCNLDVDFMPLNEHGLYDTEKLKDLVQENTLMISLTAVESETGIRQPVEKIAKWCREHHLLFHCDATQALGKVAIDFVDMDLVSISAHKIYGPKGVGALIKKEGVKIVPLLHGGHSITPFRASTPANALLAGFAKAIELSQIHLDEHYESVQKVNRYLKEQLKNVSKVHINSNDQSIPHILNISIDGSQPAKDLIRFSDKGFYLTSKTACSGQAEFSKPVFALTQNKDYAQSSYRISLSHLTTYEECDAFVAIIKELFQV